jgi:hypothetical protein
MLLLSVHPCHVDLLQEKARMQLQRDTPIEGEHPLYQYNTVTLLG